MNYLIHEKSSYLKAHAHQPVLWYPWGEEAFQKAWNENKPIVISIGYQACHWCHVMARECFEDSEVARVMNEHFVCIKVDREERPDVDQLYMDAMVLSGRPGGWPLNCFALPDGRPFYGVTYLPKKRWLELLTRIAHLYRDHPDQVKEMAQQLSNALKKLDATLLEAPPADLKPLKLPWDDIIKSLLKDIDWVWGGEWSTQKFPMAPRWIASLDIALLHSAPQLLKALHLTLAKMAYGGLFDPIEGGFMRYATDRAWRIPHFEKMLYDNGLLLTLYSLAYRVEPKPLYKRVIEKTAHFLLSEMRLPSGLFAASLSAESEDGKEGAYYAWKAEELSALLTDPKDQELFFIAHDISIEGNWQLHENLLYRALEDETLADRLGLSVEETVERLEKIYERLRPIRAQRPKPFRDEAAIISWNAYAIWGLVEAYKALGDNSYLYAAQTAAHALLPAQGSLHRLHKENSWYGEAFAEDYAALPLALIHLYTATGNETYLEKALALTEEGIQLFYDPKEQVFLFATQDMRGISLRRKDVFDTSTPSSNALFAEVLWFLGHYFQREDFHQKVRIILSRMRQQLVQNPILTAYLLRTALRETQPLLSLIYRGQAIEPFWKQYEPLIGWIGYVRSPETRIPATASYAYYPEGKWCLCVGNACRPPAPDLDTLWQYIKEEKARLSSSP
jgi:uncharacterized protein YyaL (SSP411 family)